MGMDSGVNREPNARCSDTESFGFEPGPQFTLETFQRYADDFRARYFRKIEDVHSLGDTTTVLKATVEPSVENIEGEYWRMVEKPTEEIEVTFLIFSIFFLIHEVVVYLSFSLYLCLHF